MLPPPSIRTGAPSSTPCSSSNPCCAVLNAVLLIKVAGGAMIAADAPAELSPGEKPMMAASAGHPESPATTRPATTVL